MPNFDPREVLSIDYTNWRHERSTRLVVPRRIYFGMTAWHPRLQWFLEAHDIAKGATRDFAMVDIHSMRSVGDAATVEVEATTPAAPDLPGSEAQYCPMEISEIDAETA